MLDPELGLHRARGLRSRLEIREGGSGAAQFAELVPIAGSRHLFATARGMPAAGVRVQRGLHASELGAGPWNRGWSALVAGDPTGARAAFARGRSADAAFLAAGLALVAGDLAAAHAFLGAAQRQVRGLGRELRRSNLEATLWLAAPGGLTARILPGRPDLLLALLLVESALDRPFSSLDGLIRIARADAGLKLLACDALLGGGAPTAAEARRILRLSEGERGDDAVGALILLFRARALRRVGRAGAARSLCGRVSAQAPGRSGTLGAALRLEQAAAHADLGAYAEAGKKLAELERLSPGFVARSQREGIALEVRD